MGMSASQARLISLTARMNDTEYEAQQINQQRLVLSNKMNEVQEMSINMDVPTPPSKQDFLYDVYTGKDKAGKGVSVTPNADGTFTVVQQRHGSVISKGDILDVTEGSVSSKSSGKSDSTGSTSGVKSREKILGDIHWDPGDTGRDFTVKVKDIKPETKVCTDQNVLAALAGKPLNGVTTDAGNWKLGGAKQSDITYKTDHYFDVNGSKQTTIAVEDGYEEDGVTKKYKTVSADDPDANQYGKVIEEYNNFACTSPIHTGYMVQDDSDTIDVTVFSNGILDKPSYQAAGSILDGYTYNGPDILAQDCTTQGGKKYKVSEMIPLAQNALTETGASGLASYWKPNKDLTGEFTIQDLVEDTDTYQIKKDLKMYGAVASESAEASDDADGVSSDGTTVNGRTVLTVAEADAKYGTDPNSNWGNAKAALEHSYGQNHDEWRVVVDESGDKVKFSFCKADALTQDGKVQMYEVGTGDYDDEPIIVGPESMVFDETGHPESMVLPDGTTVALTYSQEVNEIEYDKAMNKYNIAKGEYDKEQNALNKKTSMYQRQDKQLELKLTRLDNERNALNTEIEAVKKVIQDSIDRGFKTFSG